MPKISRSRTIPADSTAVWSVVGDPYNLRRWWPRVERVEQVSDGQFTEVLRSERGRAIRADHRLTQMFEEREITWEQEIEDTPFARVMTFASTSITLEATGDGRTKVTITRQQTMRGWARFGGGMMVRRATARVLDDALEHLEADIADLLAKS
ncbi:hypothetical protein DSM112329_02448 [Paraconexibacter sp. AEG42_29]|uniref:Polyketide cyclase n=1 Tax=Paraconexibacter sp. AEG42_29 TaxID=2997339 RepID=A0AAU7AVC9_9ACTN